MGILRSMDSDHFFPPTKFMDPNLYGLHESMDFEGVNCIKIYPQWENLDHILTNAQTSITLKMINPESLCCQKLKDWLYEDMEWEEYQDLLEILEIPGLQHIIQHTCINWGRAEGHICLWNNSFRVMGGASEMEINKRDNSCWKGVSHCDSIWKKKTVETGKVYVDDWWKFLENQYLLMKMRLTGVRRP